MSSDEARQGPDQAALAPDRVYDADKLWPDYSIGQMSRYCAVLHGSLGCSAHRSNLYLLKSPDTLTYIAGHQLVFTTLETGQKSYLPSYDAAIGAMAIHPSNNFIAVAEGNIIVVYSWPKLDPIRVLRQGSERGYADMTFNAIGDQLASVGTEPDYQLIIWSWNQEKVLLRTKAFSQDIYRVQFSPTYPGRLVTCGTGHIRFWTMARTFTGMKLQGHIGKFGAIDLSDIATFAELPDGKIICGTETGDLLVWEDALISYTITQSDGRSCHEGMIEHIDIDQNGTQMTTAARDGKIKRWNIEELAFVDVPDNDRYYRMTPINVYSLPDVSIVTLVEAGHNRCFVQNSNGSILSVQLNDPPQITTLQQFHSGPITAVLSLPKSYEAITFGNDRTVRLWDMLSLKLICQLQYPAAITAAIWATQRIAVAGFSDGTIRCLDIVSGSIQLAYVSKPHRKAVKCLASSVSYLATASADHTVFLFYIASKTTFALDPIGFVNIGSAIQSMDFDPVRENVLIIAAGQQVHRVQCPRPGSVDTTASYEIATDLQSFNIDLQSVIPAKRLRQIRSGFQAATTENPNDINMPPNTSSNSNRTADEPYIQPAVRQVKFSHDGTSIDVAFDGEDYGPMIITCESNTLSFSSYHELLSNGTVCEIQHGLESDLIISLSDGSVELRRNDAALRIIGHDRGSVYQNLSFDGRLLVTCGADGNFHVYRVNIDRAWEYYRLHVPDQEIQLDSVDDVVGPLPEPLDQPQQIIEYLCQDITDQTAYSLQEAKLKQEADNERTAAESRKNQIRGLIQTMRNKFSEIQKQCEKLGIPLSIDVEPTLIPRLQAQAAADVERLKREQAWHIEYRVVALNKLKQRYLDRILVERIELRSIRRPTSVTSFRTAELTDALKKDVNAVREIIAAANRIDEKRHRDSIRRPAGDAATVPLSKTSQRSSATTVQNLPKGDARKQERLARGMRRAELERLKPNANEARPEDIEAIKYTEENMGDYKLKSADSYVVPVSQRVNAVQKRRQMLLIQESVQKIKLEFNQRFLALRDLKRRLTENINRDGKRVIELNQILNDVDDEEIYEIKQYPDEWPENRDRVTTDDLKQYKKTLKERRLAQESAKKSNAYGGTAVVAEEATTNDSEDDDSNAETSARQQSSKAEIQMSENEKVHSDLLKSLPNSALEKRRHETKLRLLRHERDRLRDKIRSTITAFDDTVEELRQEKFRLEADLKQTEIKMLILYQELQLLKSFDDRESKLTASLEKSRAEKAQIVLDLTECQAKIADKLKEITEWQEKDQHLSAEFRTVVGGDKHPAYAALFKIYKRKIKRTKKKLESITNDGEDEDRGSVDASDDDSDDDFMNDSNTDSDDDDDDACPANCDNVTYERVLELRERRLDHEDQLIVFNRAVDDLKQTNDRLMAKEKAIDRDLRNNDTETEAFQSEKQRALNQIDVTIPLRISQFQYLTGDSPAPPDSLNRALIFTQTALDRLQDRIKALQTEKVTLRRDQNDLRQQHKTLTRELRSMSAAIDVERKRCEEVQILKFGRLVDIDKLKSASSNSTANDMAEQLEKLQKQWTKKLSDLEQMISEADKQLSLVTGENTKLLHMVAGLTSKQYELDRELNAASESPHLADSTGPSARHDVEERIRLVKLVQAQADEIDHLKAELAMLRRKGGYLYGPGPDLQNRQKQPDPGSNEQHDAGQQREDSILPPI